MVMPPPRQFIGQGLGTFESRQQLRIAAVTLGRRHAQLALFLLWMWIADHDTALNLKKCPVDPAVWINCADAVLPVITQELTRKHHGLARGVRAGGPRTAILSHTRAPAW